VDSLARFVIGHARFSALLMGSVVLAGAVIFLTQPRQEDPEITLRSAQVVTQAPGLAPERIEQLITRPIEDAIKEIPEIDEIQSISATGLSIVTPEVDPRFDDMAPIWSKLRNKIDDLAPRLPRDVESPVVNDDYGRVAVVTLALTGVEFSLAELYDIARDLRDEIGTLPLVARVDLYGAQPERIWLEFDTAFLAQFQLDPNEIVSALQSQNVVLPGGTINAAGENVVIEPSGDFRSVDEIRNLPIATEEGGVLYLRDIADVRRAFVDPPEAPAFFNRTPAIVLGVSMVQDSNVVALGRQVTELLESLRAELPLGTALDVAIFQPDLVQTAVNDATVNLLQTMGVVLAVVMIFLGWRTGLIVGAMVPLTMLLTLVGMSVGGIALHRISIAAIIVALGLLVDNGVVIAEDIRRRLDAGVDRLEAALGTPRTLAVPLLTSSLTTVLAFLPLMLIDDGTGEFLRSLGQVVAIALLGSWLLAISVTPALCYWFLSESGAGAEDADGAFDSRPYRAYRRLLQGILRHRIAFVGLMLILLVAAGQVFQYVKERSLGPSARNQFTVYLDLPAQAHIGQTIDAAQTMAAYLGDPEKNPEVTDVLAYVGGGGPRFFLALAPNDPQPNKAFLVVNTQTPTQVPELMRRVEDFILDELPEATGRADLLFLGPAALGTVELRVRGPEIGALRRIAADIERVFLDIGGVAGIRNDWENAVLKLRVEVDQERARRARVTSQEIAGTLSAIFDGATLTEYREGDKVIPVVLRAQAERRDSLDRLRSTEIYSSALGAPVPLLQIADIESAIEPSRIRRFNQKRAITVAGRHPDMTAQELYSDMGPSLAAIDLPAGYEVELEGELKGAAESNEKLFAYAPHALFGIVLLLVLQFDSFRRPAVILLTIPLILIGANFGLAATRAFFDFTAMLGLFSLAGIIINNGIVMIDRIDQGREEGRSVDQAVIEAALARARPILMTTITTVVGLLPLALFGGEFWFGMAVVIMSGLSVGTVLTLGFVPALYSLMFRRRAGLQDAAS
jgi:multidrug efflux pump subunit AcrB